MTTRKQSRCKGAEAAAPRVTALILEIFRLNGALLAAGDRLVADVGLTSARWQVLGAIALSPVPMPVAHIARNMGLSRQAVQRLANKLEKDGFIRFDANPHHERAKLALLTEAGTAAYREAMARQTPWVEKLAAGTTPADIEIATRLLQSLRNRLDAAESVSPGNRDQ